MTMKAFKGRCHVCGHDHSFDRLTFGQSAGAAAKEFINGVADVKDAEIARLRAALHRLLNSDPGGAIANATEDDLCEAANDFNADPVIREQAASVLQARAALAPNA